MFEFVKVAEDGSVRSCWAADIGAARWALRAYPGTVSSRASHRLGWPVGVVRAVKRCIQCGAEPIMVGTSNSLGSKCHAAYLREWRAKRRAQFASSKRKGRSRQTPAEREAARASARERMRRVRQRRSA